MKRKLDADDVPVPVQSNGSDSKPSDRQNHKSFQSFGLDSRLLQAVAQEGFSKPTPVQAQAIPPALEGKDILARSKTGSGKTLAYVLPILESILRKKASNESPRGVSALILLPTRELARQISKVIGRFTALCAKDLKVQNLADSSSDAVQRSLLADVPDVITATPGRAHVHFKNGALSLSSLSYLVIDEADLVLSYGYEDDLRSFSEALPERVQVFLMSATLGDEVETVKGIFCKDPLLLTLDDGEEENPISQYVVKCAEDEKFLLMYVIVKLNLIKGKCIVFVGDIDRCYRLKLFLEQFSVRSCVLNSELPVNSRIHVVEEFNKNVYNIIIASDEHEVLGPVASRKRSTAEREDSADEEAADGTKPPQEPAAPPSKQKKKSSRRSKEYGISRGIDFQNVACVLNFDLPPTSKAYTHRIGRTGRAGKSGMALSFVIPGTLYRKHPPTSFGGSQHDEEILAKIQAHQAKKGRAVQDYRFDMAQVDAFRYRMNDALRAVTGTAVQAARARELRQELLTSEKLQRHFEEHPDDLHHLRHDGELRVARTQAHLKHVPGYLLPNRGDGAGAGDKGLGFVGFQKTSENRIRKARANNFARGKGRKGASGGRRTDPLKTFSAKGKPKRKR